VDDSQSNHNLCSIVIATIDFLPSAASRSGYPKGIIQFLNCYSSARSGFIVIAYIMLLPRREMFAGDVMGLIGRAFFRSHGNR
jgi:hypothetical protein